MIAKLTPRHALAGAALVMCCITGGLAHALTPMPVLSCESPLFAKDSSHQRLTKFYGVERVRVKVETGPKGMQPHVYSVVFPASALMKMTVKWKNGADRSQPDSFLIEKPSQWIAPGHLRIGSTLAEVEQINGGRFIFTGFAGETDGMAFLTGKLAKLPGGCSLSLTFEAGRTLSKAEMNRIKSETDFASDDPLMRKALVRVSQIVIHYGEIAR